MALRRIYARFTGTTDTAAPDVRRAALETYRTTYERACRGLGWNGLVPPVELPEGVGTREHAFALFCALTGRNGAAGPSRRLTWPVVRWRWVELSPFLYLRQDHAQEALGEYVLWKEETDRPRWADPRARTDWLGERVREGVRRAEEVEPHGLIAVARQTARRRGTGGPARIRWPELL